MTPNIELNDLQTCRWSKTAKTSNDCLSSYVRLVIRNDMIGSLNSYDNIFGGRLR